MKVLSVRQPFASLICAGIKTVENRTWKTPYRGDILIHASKDEKISEFDLPLPVHQDWLKCTTRSGHRKDGIESEYIDVLDNGDIRLKKEHWKNENLRKEFQFLKGMLDEMILDEKTDFYPLSAIIGRVEIVDIQQNYNSVWSNEDSFNWILKNPFMFCKPILPIKGKLRIWNFEKPEEMECYDFEKVGRSI
jgi:hypothetical protein